MALGTTNILISGVRTALSAAINSISGLCTHVNINKWSKKKPVRGTFPQATDGKFGLDPANSWNYLRPQGSYRIGDFRGYEHDKTLAYPPIQCRSNDVALNATLYPVPPEPGLDPYSNSWRVRVFKALSDIRITPADLGLTNYYYGIKITINGGTPWYKTFGNVDTTDDNGVSFSVDASLRTDQAPNYYYDNLPYGNGTYAWQLFLSSSQHLSWTQVTPTNYIPFPAETIGGTQIISSGSFTVAGWAQLSDQNFVFTYTGGLHADTSLITFLGGGDWTVQSKPDWITVQCWDYSGTPFQLTNPSLWHSGTYVRLDANTNYAGLRNGTVVISANGAIISISVEQAAAPAVINYQWVVGSMESFTLSNQVHGMSAGSANFDLSFDHTFAGDAYKYWSISKQGVGVLASGSGNPGGIRLRTGITAVKAGTLSQALQNGDIITIQIGLGGIE